VKEKSQSNLTSKIYRLTRFFLFGNLIVESAIVVTGGAVRLTGSGLGCPTWPDCTKGKLSPIAHPAAGYHSWIEFGNRLLTFALVVFAFAAVGLTVLPFAKKLWEKSILRKLRFLALTQVLGIVLQAVVGGISVLTKLNPAVVGLHFLISIPIISAAFTLQRKAKLPQPEVLRITQEPINHLIRALALITGLVILVGTVVTGSGPHSGDAKAKRYPFSARDVAWLHADLVIALISLTIGLALLVVLVKPSKNPKHLQILTFRFIAISLGQGAIGYIQFFTHLPIALVGAHILGVTLVWISIWDIVSTTGVFSKMK
jgi:heme a synthase